MITVISGTNRPDSRTLSVANHFLHQLREAGAAVQLLDLAEIDMGFYVREMYDAKRMSPSLAALQDKYILSVNKLAFVVPEYNGSYPGVVKLFIDGISINEYPRNLGSKHIGLIGVSSGRAGNLRGLDHLSATINHMGGWVLPNKLPVSNVEELVDEQGIIANANTTEALKKLAAQLIAA